MSKHQIIAIDDDTQNLDLIREMLSERYDVSTFSDPAQGLAAVLASAPDLVIIDLDMPVMDGFEVCEAIRSSAPHDRTAVLFLTSDTDAASMQRALHVGANDYLTKPFRLHELLTRIEFRVGQAHIEAPLRCGNLSIDPATLSAAITHGGKQRTFRITTQSLRVLEVLIRNEGRLLNREQLLEKAWSGAGESVSDRSVDLTVFRLRKLLSDWSHRIESVYGKGYIVLPKKKG